MSCLDAAFDIAMGDFDHWGDAERMVPNVMEIWGELSGTRPAVSREELWALMARYYKQRERGWRFRHSLLHREYSATGRPLGRSRARRNYHSSWRARRPGFAGLRSLGIDKERQLIRTRREGRRGYRRCYRRCGAGTGLAATVSFVLRAALVGSRGAIVASGGDRLHIGATGCHAGREQTYDDCAKHIHLDQMTAIRTR